jgi:sec-independent protein translocase protein TatB
MFGVGGQELVLLMVIGLIVLGPERLPRIATQIGGWLGQARRMTRVMKRQLEEELDVTKPKTIKPPPALREPSQQPVKEPELTPPRDDDDYSPAHGEEEVGTGVGEEIYDDESDLAVTEEDLATASAIDDEPAGPEDGVEKKTEAS